MANTASHKWFCIHYLWRINYELYSSRTSHTENSRDKGFYQSNFSFASWVIRHFTEILNSWPKKPLCCSPRFAFFLSPCPVLEQVALCDFQFQNYSSHGTGENLKFKSTKDVHFLAIRSSQFMGFVRILEPCMVFQETFPSDSEEHPPFPWGDPPTGVWTHHCYFSTATSYSSSRAMVKMLSHRFAHRSQRFEGKSTVRNGFDTI